MRYLSLIFCSVILVQVKAQFYTLPNHYIFQQIQDNHLLSSDTNISTSVYPRNPFIVQTFPDVDTNHRMFQYIKNDYILDKFVEKDVILVKTDKLQIKIDPILNFQKGQQTLDTNISAYTNTRGFIASLKLENVYLETLLSENQSVFPDYLYRYSKDSLIVPGQGRWKTFKTSGFDYAFSAGLISIQASKNINFTIGSGKHKIGNGYRSLLVSDNAFVYPFFKLEQNWWKGRLQYVCTYALLNNLVSASEKIPSYTERLFQKKPFVYHYLNIGIFKRTRIGFFQGIIGETPDRTNRWRGDGILFSPVIYSQLLYYGWDNKNNVLAGMDIQQKLMKTLMIYGQFVMDTDKPNYVSDRALGYQIGFKWLGKFQDWNIFWLAEWNVVTGNAYSSPTTDAYPYSSYSHFNQNMAYTIHGGNELMSILSIKKGRWVLYNQVNSINSSPFAKNITYYKGIFGFVINPSYNMMINLGIENRVADKNNNYIYLQLQTALYNIYYDF